MLTYKIEIYNFITRERNISYSYNLRVLRATARARQREGSQVIISYKGEEKARYEPNKRTLKSIIKNNLRDLYRQRLAITSEIENLEDMLGGERFA